MYFLVCSIMCLIVWGYMCCKWVNMPCRKFSGKNFIIAFTITCTMIFMMIFVITCTMVFTIAFAKTGAKVLR